VIDSHKSPSLGFESELPFFLFVDKTGFFGSTIMVLPGLPKTIRRFTPYAARTAHNPDNTGGKHRFDSR
jgi:hypothetical protein